MRIYTKAIIALIMAFCLLDTSCFAQSDKPHWATESAQKLIASNTVKDLTLTGLDENISRADFLNWFLSVALSYDSTSIKGELFNSDDPITRADAAIIISFALKLRPEQQNQSKFTDIGRSYARSEIKSLEDAELVIGYNGAFNPNKYLTKAETLVILARILEKSDDLRGKNLEIERKFIIDKEKIPFDISEADTFKIVQTYVNYSPEVRVREINDSYHSFAIKLPKDEIGLVRQEIEIYITKSEYDYLLSKAAYQPIYKTRYQYDSLAIDIYSGDLEGLNIGEIEFHSEDDANAFTPGDWILEDVTNDKRYKNANLARDGMPK